MKEKMKLLSKKIQGLSFYSLLMIGYMVVGSTSAFAGWDLNTTDSKVRGLLGTILFIIAAIMAIKAYAKGRKGTAVAEILVGAFLGIFVSSSDPMKALQEFAKSIFGF